MTTIPDNDTVTHPDLPPSDRKPLKRSKSTTLLPSQFERTGIPEKYDEDNDLLQNLNGQVLYILDNNQNL